MSHLARSVTVVSLWNVCELKVSRWQHQMQVFFICLPLLTPLPANAGREGEQQQETSASMCVSVYVLYFCVCCVTVCARLDHFCWFCSQSQHLRLNGEVGGRLFDWRFLQLHNQCVRVRARNASPSTYVSVCSCDGCCWLRARHLYVWVYRWANVRLSLCVGVCRCMCRRILNKWKWHKYL